MLLSESQERMLIVIKKGREADVQKVFDKWISLRADRRVTADKN